MWASLIVVLGLRGLSQLLPCSIQSNCFQRELFGIKRMKGTFGNISDAVENVMQLINDIRHDKRDKFMVALLYQCTSIRFMTVVKDHAIYIFYAKQRPVLFAFEYIFILYRSFLWL